MQTKRRRMLEYWKTVWPPAKQAEFESKVQALVETGERREVAEMKVFETPFVQEGQVKQQTSYLQEEEVENFDLKYEMYFQQGQPDELIKKFAKLEEDNLALINARQEIMETFQEENAKFLNMEIKKKEAIEQAEIVKKQLENQKRALSDKVQQMRETAKEKSRSNSEVAFDDIELEIARIIFTFQKEKELKFSELGVIDSKEAKNKENLLNYLKSIENLLIEMITQLRASCQDNADWQERKRRKNELESKRRKDREMEQLNIQMRQKMTEEALKKQAQRLEALARSKGRKDMFKKVINEKEEKVEDKAVDNQHAKYFMD